MRRNNVFSTFEKVKLIALTLALLAAAIVMLGVKVLFVKGGKFPSGHAHNLEARRRQAQARLRENEKTK